MNEAAMQFTMIRHNGNRWEINGFIIQKDVEHEYWFVNINDTDSFGSPYFHDCIEFIIFMVEGVD